MTTHAAAPQSPWTACAQPVASVDIVRVKGGSAVDRDKVTCPDCKALEPLSYNPHC